MIICSEIKCPWWSAGSNNYGCQRFSLSSACHLLPLSPDIRGNEYGLYADKLTPKQLQGLKNENNRLCLEDPKYQRDREFFAEHPDWIGENTFVPKEIVR